MPIKDEGIELERKVAAILAASNFFVLRRIKMYKRGDELTDIDVWGIRFNQFEKSFQEEWCIVSCKSNVGRSARNAFELLGVISHLEHHYKNVKIKGFLVQSAKQIPDHPKIELIKPDSLHSLAKSINTNLEKKVSSYILDHWHKVYQAEENLTAYMTRSSLGVKKSKDICGEENLKDRFSCLICNRECGQRARMNARILFHSLQGEILWMYSKPRQLMIKVLGLSTKHLFNDVARELRMSGERDPSHHPIAQAAAYIQHKLRLVSLLTLIEHIIRDPSSLDRPLWGNRPLPELDVISYLLPCLQSFMLSWGGFIWLDHKEEELEAIGKEIGVNKDIAWRSISFYQEFFRPRSGSFNWLREISGRVLHLMFYPRMMRGLGVLKRRMLYGGEYEFPDEWKEWADSTKELLSL